MTACPASVLQALARGRFDLPLGDPLVGYRAGPLPCRPPPRATLPRRDEYDGAHR